MSEQTARRGPGRPRKSEAVSETPKAAPSGEVTILVGWRATWSTKGRIAPETKATLPADEAARIVEKGLARYA